MTGPAGKWCRPSPMVPRFGSRDPSLWRPVPAPRSAASGVKDHRKQARQRDGKAQPGSNIFILAITGQNRIPGTKTFTRGVLVLSPSVHCSVTVPGSCRGRYHTDRQPGAALQNTAMCPAGPPARSWAARAGGLGAPGVPRLIAIGEPAQPDGWQNFMYSSWRTAGQYAKQHEPARQAPRAGRQAPQADRRAHGPALEQHPIS
jgi:hypothetical protein